MNYSWRYPIYLISHGVGYASLVDPSAEVQPTHLLVVCSERQTAEDVITQFAIHGSIRPLHNDREFRRLLQCLRPPVTHVAFDPRPTTEKVNPTWCAPVAELLRHYVAADNSPWNYPVYAIAQDAGFACIQGEASDGRSLIAVGLFTNLQKAHSYLSAAGESGTPCAVADLDEACRFLDSLAPEVNAVALDPTVSPDGRTARYCFALETLRMKYLVRDFQLGDPSEAAIVLP